MPTLTDVLAVLDYVRRCERMIQSPVARSTHRVVMKTNHLTRRQFLGRSAGAASALLLTSCPWFVAEAATKRTAVDQVALGKTGLKLSRLGFGTGSNSGNVQYALGQEAFNKLIR